MSEVITINLPDFGEFYFVDVFDIFVKENKNFDSE